MIGAWLFWTGVNITDRMMKNKKFTNTLTLLSSQMTSGRSLQAMIVGMVLTTQYCILYFDLNGSVMKWD